MSAISDLEYEISRLGGLMILARLASNKNDDAMIDEFARKHISQVIELRESAERLVMVLNGKLSESQENS